MDIISQILTGIGGLAFGLVVGWVTYRTLRRSNNTAISDIATVIGAVGGAAVTSLFPAQTIAFSLYCIGLAIGFFGYLRTAINQAAASGKAAEVNEWLGGASGGGGTVNNPGLPPTVH